MQTEGLKGIYDIRFKKILDILLVNCYNTNTCSMS